MRRTVPGGAAAWQRRHRDYVAWQHPGPWVKWKSASQFAAEIAALGIAADDGVPILCNALAGIDAAEIFDSLSLAAALRGALAHSLCETKLGARDFCRDRRRRSARPGGASRRHSLDRASEERHARIPEHYRTLICGLLLPAGFKGGGLGFNIWNIAAILSPWQWSSDGRIYSHNQFST